MYRKIKENFRFYKSTEAYYYYMNALVVLDSSLMSELN